MNISEKHRRFCEEYIKDFNAAAAARRAGYTKGSADRAIGHLILQREEVQAYLDELLKGVRDRNQLEVDIIVQELKSIAFSDIGNYYDSNNNLLPANDIEAGARLALEQYHNDTVPTIHGTKKLQRIKLASKLDAIEKLMRYLGAYEKDNQQKTGDPQQRSTDSLMDELADIRRRRAAMEEE